MRTRAEIKQQAKEAFKTHYGAALLGLLLNTLLVSCASSITLGLGFLLVIPLNVGLTFYFNCIAQQRKPEIGDLFEGFQRYGRCLGGMLWMQLWTLLWSMLWIVPGIIKGLSYSMTPYILADCPNVPATEAIKLSMRMTKGHKGKIFVFGLSFIGWWLLSILTFGILAFFYVGPYSTTAQSALYFELKHNAIDEGIIHPEELQ